jgi:hypothetical protein
METERESYLEAEGVEHQRAGRCDVEVQHGEPERLQPGHHPEQLPRRPPRRHHPHAGVRVHHHARLHVRHPGRAARRLRHAAVVLPRPRVEPRVLRVPEEPRERRRRILAVLPCGGGVWAPAHRRSRRRGASCATFRGRHVVIVALLLQQQALLRKGLQLLLKLLHTVYGAADDGRLVALQIDRRYKN